MAKMDEATRELRRQALVNDFEQRLYEYFLGNVKDQDEGVALFETLDKINRVFGSLDKDAGALMAFSLIKVTIEAERRGLIPEQEFPERGL